jgi:tRNA uridine 5-carbamoylmethylation protein Kti12
MALHINIFGAPGSGKSTMRSRLFYELKKQQLKVEEVVEYAKELTYGEDGVKLSDQILMFGRQRHPHFVLDKKVDYVITDSPFIMGFTYVDDAVEYKDELKALMLKVHNSYRTLNIFINRNHEYQEFGRNQTAEQSDEKALEIKALLDECGIEFYEFKSGEETIQNSLTIIGALEQTRVALERREND